MSQITKKTGVAFSGGGIRSAAICSGVLRRLLQKNVPFDYLSTVSGGGFVGVSYMDWKYRKQSKDDPSWHNEFFEQLRQHSNALCDCYHPCEGITVGTINALWILFLSLGITVLRAFSLLVPTMYIMNYIVGDLLRAQFTCFGQNANITLPGMSHDYLMTRCVPKFGSNLLPLLNLLFSLFVVFAISYYLSALTRRRTLKYFLVLVAQVSLYALLMTALPWFLEAYASFSPPWARFFIVGVVLLSWIGLPSVRDKASIAMMMLAFAYFIKWMIFKTNMFGLEYTDETFWKLIWAAGIILWLHPYIGMMQMYLWHKSATYKHERTYFSPESRAAALKRLYRACRSSSSHCRSLTLADLVDVQPSLQCNVTVNNWRKTNDIKEQDFEVLTFTPNSIERIDRGEDDVEFDAAGFLRPKDVTLSDIMMTSAAILSYDLGNFEDRSHSFREIRVLLGLGFGNIQLAQPGLTKSWMSWVVTFIIQILFGLLIIGVPVGLYLEILKDWEFWERFGLIAYICCFLLMSILAMLPTGEASSGWFDIFVRWCIINILHVRIMRTLFGVTNVGSTPPPVMSLSDGGHAENLGILPLLKLRLPRIVVVNGGVLFPGENEGTELLKALKQARQKLHCSFTGMSGRDIEEDIRAEFVETSAGKQPRSYRFKVSYYDVIDKKERRVGEGEVLFLMPRHPEEGFSDFQNHKWRDCDGDIKLDLDEKAWGLGPGLKTSEVERLSGCCFECCHWKFFNCILNPIMGNFPHQSTFNQMFTPSQFSAYHREGFYMALESRTAEFLVEYQQDVDHRSSSPSNVKIDVIDTHF